MNGSLKPAMPTEFGNWLEKCRHKYVGACVHGSGQFLVRVFDGKNVYLHETLDAAQKHVSQDPKFRLEDLSIEPVRQTNGFSNIKSQSDWEDKLWERRQEREKRERG